MQLTATEKIDIVNIGLMLVACCVAMIIPFELFLFSYALLGPLHYLTEISWLHDRKYFTKGKYDALMLVIIGLMLTVFHLNDRLQLALPDNLNAYLTYIALLGAIIFALVKNNFLRIAGLILLIVTSKISENFLVFFVIFLPTLVHVYIFTGLFMLYGAIKSKSRFGILSVLVLIMCPVLLYNIYPNRAFFHITGYGKNVYESFKLTNIATLSTVMHYPRQASLDAWNSVIYSSRAGILLMRFIAFAYTYHYLNWFSKTKVIQWHKVPRIRFVGVLVLWAISVSLYLYNYLMGMEWLFFLSYLHVILEFPLNVTSIVGIGRHLQSKIIKPAASTTGIG